MCFLFFNLFSNCNSKLKEKEINKDQFGERWPFTVDRGILRCEHGMYVTFENNGLIYGVNGAASSFYKSDLNFHDIVSICQDDIELGKPFKKDIQPIINAGLKLCK